MALQSRFLGCGHYLPERIVTNDDLAKTVDTSHDWIVERTGIQSRHFAEDGVLTSDLATKAAENALKNAGLKADDIDLVIVATVTPDRTFPSTATLVQKNLDMNHGVAFDVSAACSGYLVALSTAHQYLKSGHCKKALVIGAETFSRIIDMNDRTTCVLFGDGAGAVVLSAENSNQDRGIIGLEMHSDGRCEGILKTSGGTSLTKTAGFIQMQGREVYRHAVNKLTESAISIMQSYDVSNQDIDWMIPHQANLRIIEAVAKRLEVADEKIITTVDHHANTSAASIPLALSEAWQDGKIKDGDLIIHEALGAGLIWGSALLRW